MVNTDKVKAARTGGDVKYKQKVAAIHTAGRVAHANEKRVAGVHSQLRSFEDAGKGVATGRQYEHEERMREQQQRRKAKEAKAAAFRDTWEVGDEATEDAPELRFEVGDRVRCRTGPRSWAAGTVVQLWYREDTWPEDVVAPYQVKLDGSDDLIFAPADEDEVIRAALTVPDRENVVFDFTSSAMSSMPAGSSSGAGSSSSGAGSSAHDSERVTATYWY